MGIFAMLSGAKYPRFFQLVYHSKGKHLNTRRTRSEQDTYQYPGDASALHQRGLCVPSRNRTGTDGCSIYILPYHQVSRRLGWQTWTREKALCISVL